MPWKSTICWRERVRGDFGYDARQPTVWDKCGAGDVSEDIKGRPLKYGSMWKLGVEICGVNEVVNMGQLGWVIDVKGPEGCKDMVEDVHDRVEEVVYLELVENKLMKVFGVRQGGMKAARGNGNGHAILPKKRSFT